MTLAEDEQLSYGPGPVDDWRLSPEALQCAELLDLREHVFNDEDMGFEVETDNYGQTIVCEVTPGGEAERLGLKVGDRVLFVEGDSSGKYDDLCSALERPARPLTLRVTRSGEAGPCRDHPFYYGRKTDVDDDGTFAPYTILTATQEEGESAPVVPAQKPGPKKGATYKMRSKVTLSGAKRAAYGSLQPDGKAKPSKERHCKNCGAPMKGHPRDGLRLVCPYPPKED